MNTRIGNAGGCTMHHPDLMNTRIGNAGGCTMHHPDLTNLFIFVWFSFKFHNHFYHV